jgi:23S rRNA U2552 (ribose-2'-O)-methylase RlmE/FtsJ
MKKLFEIYQKYQTPDGQGDKGTAHSYIEKYEELLSPYRNNSTVLEIGIAGGYSMNMWGEYFTNSKIYGMDISPEILFNDFLKNTKFTVLLADATSPDCLDTIKDLTFDVVIDDGSHVFEDQIKSFKLLKHKINKNGLYIIEDISNLDKKTKQIFESLHDVCEIIDLRHIKNRYDDVLVVYRF